MSVPQTDTSVDIFSNYIPPDVELAKPSWTSLPHPGFSNVTNRSSILLNAWEVMPNTLGDFSRIWLQFSIRGPYFSKTVVCPSGASAPASGWEALGCWDGAPLQRSAVQRQKERWPLVGEPGCGCGLSVTLLEGQGTFGFNSVSLGPMCCLDF